MGFIVIFITIVVVAAKVCSVIASTLVFAEIAIEAFQYFVS